MNSFSKQIQRFKEIIEAYPLTTDHVEDLQLLEYALVEKIKTLLDRRAWIGEHSTNVRADGVEAPVELTGVQLGSSSHEEVKTVDGLVSPNLRPAKLSCTICKFKTFVPEDFCRHLDQHCLTLDDAILATSIDDNLAALESLDQQDDVNSEEAVPEPKKKRGRKPVFPKKGVADRPLRKCDLCDYQTRNNTNLLRHIRTHTGEKPFKCDLCDFSTADQGCCRKHKLYKHGLGKRTCCEVCGFMSTPYYLKRHMDKHMGIKRFQCEHCDYATSEISHMNTHKRRHTGDKPYHCEQCDYKCARKDYLTSHLKTHAKREARGKRADGDTPSTE